MLGPRFIPQSVFYTQSVILSPRFIPSPCFIPSPQSVVRSPCFILTGSVKHCARCQPYCHAPRACCYLVSLIHPRFAHNQLATFIIASTSFVCFCICFSSSVVNVISLARSFGSMYQRCYFSSTVDSTDRRTLCDAWHIFCVWIIQQKVTSHPVKKRAERQN